MAHIPLQDNSSKLHEDIDGVQEISETIAGLTENTRAQNNSPGG
jgi:hypothetical protein